MKQTQLIMGMPITVEILEERADQQIFDKVFLYFQQVDAKFSLYKPNSQISQINRGEIKQPNYDQEIKLIFKLAESTRRETNGFFDIHNPQKKIIDPSGIVKGWAIHQAAEILKKAGLNNFYIEAGGDIQASGFNNQGNNWRIGLRHPFKKTEIIKVISLTNQGIATSGNYERGYHIYNPVTNQFAKEIASLTVIGPNIYEADRFATAAFAMGEKGISFIENKPLLEGYQIGYNGIATMTTGFKKFVTT